MHLTLVNAATDVDIGPLRNGTVIDVAQFSKLSVRANVVPLGNASSVLFTINGRVSQIENEIPYALSGSKGNDYVPWTPSVGSYTIGATAHSSKNAKGNPLSTISVSILVKDLSGLPGSIASTVHSPRDSRFGCPIHHPFHCSFTARNALACLGRYWSSCCGDCPGNDCVPVQVSSAIR
jgi:hypothetical protein